MAKTINYGGLMHKAMRGLMIDLLRDVAKNGLPGEHHFFITLDTTHEAVDIADWLRERYPEEMTIVMQHWFEDLVVEEDHFAVTLNFGNDPERLVIPYDSVSTFVDPSVDFGLRFDTDEMEDVDESPMIVIEDEEDEDDQPHRDADVVSLDSFRKP